MKERTFYTINLDFRRISVIGMILVLLLVYSFILGHTIGKRNATKDSSEVAEKTETSKILTNNRPTIKSDEESSLDAVEEMNKQKAEVINLNEADSEKSEEIPIEKPEKQTRKKKTRKTLDEQRVYYTMQMGAFSSKEQAQKYVEKIISESKLTGGNYKPAIVPKGELHVVQIGKFSTRDEAETSKSKLDPKIQASTIIQKAISR